MNRQRPSILEMMQKNERTKVNDDIDRAFNYLVKDPIKGVLPEREFVNVFLRLFCGEAGHDFGLLLNYWIAVAGSYMSEVDIIDQRGMVLFTVPAIQSSSFLSPVQKGPSYSEIMAEYGNQQNRSSQVANAFLAQQFEAKAQQIVAPPPSQTDRERWVAILARYGKTLPVPALPGQISQKNTGSDDDELVFE